VVEEEEEEDVFIKKIYRKVDGMRKREGEEMKSRTNCRNSKR
jgi:hypothetical protein